VLIAGTSAATLISAASFAEPTSRIEIGQTSSGQVEADDAVNAEIGETVNSIAVAQANSATGMVTDWTAVTGVQDFSGSSSASSTVEAGDIWSWIISNAAAQGNGLNIETHADLELDFEQRAASGASVDALSALRVSDYAAHTVQGVTAAANAVEVTGSHFHDINLTQSSQAEVNASAVLEAENARIETAALGASAAGNSFKGGGYDSDVIAFLDQDNEGAVTAETRAAIGDARWGVTAAAEAAGNTAVINNIWGYAHAQGVQTNSGEVRALAELQLGEFSDGVASATAHAVGNNALVSNIGADAFTGLAQTNTGAVTGEARFLGGAGGGSGAGGGYVLAASAIGNAQSGFVCAECPVGLTGYVDQVNSGPVTARTNSLSQGYTPFISSSATAVGNAATFSVQTPGH